MELSKSWTLGKFLVCMTQVSWIAIVECFLKWARWCAWDSNPVPQNGRRRRNHGAMAATRIVECLYDRPKGLRFLHISHSTTAFKKTSLSNTFWQCDQIGRFIGLWATFESLWQQFICPNLPKFLGNFWKGDKIYQFSSEVIFGQLLLTFGDFFWSQCFLDI